MRNRYPHILRVTIALWAMMLPLVLYSTTEAATFHTPKPQEGLPQFLQAMQQEAPQNKYAQPKKQKIKPAQQSSAPRSSALMVPTITVQNPLLNRQISVQSTGTSNVPQAQMYSVATRLRETHRNSQNTSSQGPMFAVNDCAQTTSFASSTITPVGASEAAPMYSVVTPAPRRVPPGTGGGDPVNPDIPVPVGSGVWILMMAAVGYAGYRKRQSAQI